MINKLGQMYIAEQEDFNIQTRKKKRAVLSKIKKDDTI